jgi:membrane protein required for colicin V production
MEWVDIVILGVIGISALVSIVRGFVKELLSLIAWGAAFFLSINFYENLASLLTFTDDRSIKVVLALFILFVGTLIFIGILNYIITLALKKTGLSGTDRLLGMVFGTLRGLCIVLVVAAIFQLLINWGMFTSVTRSEWYTNAVVLPEINKIATQVLIQIKLI